MYYLAKSAVPEGNCVNYSSLGGDVIKLKQKHLEAQYERLTALCHPSRQSDFQREQILKLRTTTENMQSKSVLNGSVLLTCEICVI